MSDPVLRARSRVLRRNPTLAEAKLWSLLRCKQLGVKVKRQCPIGWFIVDFYIPSRKLAIEVDGISHRDKHRYDYWRSRVLLRHGIKIIRVTNEQVFKYPTLCVKYIKENL